MIKIEVTGTSIGEVADKLLAIGASLRANNLGWSAPTSTVVGQEVTEDKAARVMVTKSNSAKAEVAEAAPVDPTPEGPTSISKVAETTDQPLSQPSETTPPASASEPLNFELDVAPVVLRAVAAKGKPFVQDVLSEFGGARASDLDEALWPELVNRLEDEMA